MTPQFRASLRTRLKEREIIRNKLHKFFRKIRIKIMGNNLKNGRYVISGSSK